jgi:hypothetical protein
MASSWKSLGFVVYLLIFVTIFAASVDVKPVEALRAATTWDRKAVLVLMPVPTALPPTPISKGIASPAALKFSLDQKVWIPYQSPSVTCFSPIASLSIRILPALRSIVGLHFTSYGKSSACQAPRLAAHALTPSRKYDSRNGL